MHITCRKDTTLRTLTADPFFSTGQHLNLFSMLRVLELHQADNIMLRGHCILEAYAQDGLLFPGYEDATT